MMYVTSKHLPFYVNSDAHKAAPSDSLLKASVKYCLFFVPNMVTRSQSTSPPTLQPLTYILQVHTKFFCFTVLNTYNAVFNLIKLLLYY